MSDVFALGVGLPIDQPRGFPAVAASPLAALGKVHAADVVRGRGAKGLAKKDRVHRSPLFAGKDYRFRRSALPLGKGYRIHRSPLPLGEG